ncbi:MAG: HD domain-containing protein [Deltaproteobacteria bacterium]|nr:HD domain-containing protein [Deltaproteobacteria bacterium]
MAKVYAKDVHDKDTLKSVFQVARKTPTTAKNGKPFLAVVLRDKTGDLDARVWERIEELDPLFTRGDYVEVEGAVTTFQGRPQLKIDALQKVDPAGLDLADFTAPVKPEPGERHLAPIQEIIDRIHDPFVKALCKSFLDDEAFLALFKRAPAAKTIPHAHHGGLAEHTLSVMRLAQRLSDQYPMADRDLLVAGAFLHDLGKLKELTWERQTEYTDEGRLVGHLVIASEWIHERAACIEGFPPVLEAHLKHLILSHHGALEFGSPRLPQTLEAMILHHIDELDSRVNSWLEVMKRDSGETWTDFQKLYDRHLYKGAAPTVGGKAPVERRHRKDRPRRERPEGAEKGAAAAGVEAGQAESGAAKPVRPERPERPARPEKPAEGAEAGAPRERRERGPKKPEEKLTFKPFAVLVAETPEPEPTPPSAEAQAPESAEPSAPSTEAPPSPAPAQDESTPPAEPSNGG